MTEIQGGPPPAAEPVAPAAGAAGAKFKAAAPVAAGTLAIVAAIAGASVLGGNGADTAPAGQVIASTEAPANPAAPTTSSATSETAPLPIDPAMNPPAVSVAPAPKPGGSIPGVQFDQAPAAGAAQGIEIVVKLKDDAKVKDIVDAFWKDQASAKTKFDAWKARRPEFAGLKLDRVTYSNELVLVHDGSVAAGQRIAAMRNIATKLGKTADISYAEPNLTAHPGGQ